MLKFGTLGSKYWGKNVRFEISTFEKAYRQNFIKIKMLILFGPKCPSLRIWAKNIRKTISNLK